MNTLEFLQALYGHAEEGWLTLTFKKVGGGSMMSEFFPIDDLNRIARRAQSLADQHDVWFGVATRGAKLARGRGGASDCLEVPGLWLDLDVTGPNHKTADPLPESVDEAIRFLDRFPLEPSIIVSSGGGVHGYFLFDEMMSAAEAGPILQRWHHTWQGMADDEGWALDNVSDLARILRVPGTLNHKNNMPMEVKVL